MSCPESSTELVRALCVSVRQHGVLSNVIVPRKGNKWNSWGPCKGDGGERHAGPGLTVGRAVDGGPADADEVVDGGVAAEYLVEEGVDDGDGVGGAVAPGRLDPATGVEDLGPIGPSGPERPTVASPRHAPDIRRPTTREAGYAR